VKLRKRKDPVSAGQAPLEPDPAVIHRAMRHAVTRQQLEPLLHPGRHHPFQLWILGACALTGLGLLLDEPAPNAIEASMPRPFVIIWAVSLGICGVLGITAALWRDAGTALILERASMIPLGGMFIVYAIAITHYAPNESARARLIAFLGVAALWRGVQVWRKIRILQRVGPPDDT
jgi:hypothetical protein